MMEPTSRRQFLKRTGAVAAATAAVAAVPATAAKALSRRDVKNDDPALPDHPDVDLPVFAHVKDVRKGIVAVYTGEQEIVVKNKRLAAALYHASR
jgi:hypothetical protein